MKSFLLAVVSLVMGLTAFIGIIRAQQYDDQRLRDLLEAPDMPCPAPCLMGIQPGVTTREDALVRLQAHRWVGDVLVDDTQIAWRWSGQQPEALTPRLRGFLFRRSNARPDVEMMVLGVDGITFADVAALLGAPDEGFPGVNAYLDGTELNLIYDYPDGLLQFRGMLECPQHFLSLWRMPVNTVILNDEAQTAARPYSELLRWLRGEHECR